MSGPAESKAPSDVGTNCRWTPRDSQWPSIPPIDDRESATSSEYDDDAAGTQFSSSVSDFLFHSFRSLPVSETRHLWSMTGVVIDHRWSCSLFF